MQVAESSAVAIAQRDIYRQTGRKATTEEARAPPHHTRLTERCMMADSGYWSCAAPYVGQGRGPPHRESERAL